MVIVAVMASMAMVALEATIVSTAMPQIVMQLGGLHLYSWVFSSFLLAQTAMTVVFGKLADLYGRKPVILTGIAIFLAGSVLAGCAWSMPAMIVFRLIQGIGAGAILPVTLTIVGDLYPAHERGKVQGYLASVWAVSAVLGPMAGSFIVSQITWAWIFWINLPIGLLAALGFVAFLGEQHARKHRSIDFAGATYFTAAVAALMMVLTYAGSASWTRLAIEISVLVASLLLFVWQEQRARDPMISFRLWGQRAVFACNGATLFSGMALMGLTAFLPMYVQVVMNRSPLVAGFALTMMMVGWPAGATISSRTFHRIGLRRILIAGSLFLPAGATIFATLRPESSPVLAGVGSLVMGFGMGILSVCSLVLIQEIVPVSDRGSATASSLFARNLGNTLGAALLGAVQNFGMHHVAGPAAVSVDQLREAIDAAGKQAADNVLVREALHHSLHLTFCATLAIALCAIGSILLLPSIQLSRRENTQPN